MSAPEMQHVAAYELLAKIAEGDSSVVYHARDVRLGREVAVKIALPHADLGRLVNGVRAHAVLAHPNIVPVCEANQLPDGRAYQLMSLIKGATLAEIVRDSDLLGDRGRFLTAFEQVCQALAYAHSRGVIHRNLMPRKVMIGAFGEVLVIGWGRARRVGESDSPQTRVPPTMTSAPVYAAPEQIRGERETTRTDVFGLGGVLCFILTGKPTHAGGILEIVTRCAEGDFSETFARLDTSGADPELVAVAKRCLAPNPADRFADAGEVARALVAYHQPAVALPVAAVGPSDRQLAVAYVIAALVVLLPLALLLWRL